MLRQVFIVLDFSLAALATDFRPTRATVILRQLKDFVTRFFDQNPLGSLGLISTKEKKASIISPMSSNARVTINVIEEMEKQLADDADQYCLSEPSCQMSLTKAFSYLGSQAKYFSKEIILVMNSLKSCDISNLKDTAKMLRNDSVKCNIIHLSAQVELYQQLAKETGGEMIVPKNENEIDQIFIRLSKPVILEDDHDASASTMIKMGFPSFLKNSNSSKYRMTTNTSSSTNDLSHTNQLSTEGYECPQCGLNVTSIPVQCPTCNLQLVTAPHLARSHHHLFPVPKFTETIEDSTCSSCGVGNIKVTKNPESDNCFCLDCEIFMREKLHFSF